jgi:hypothetical protein
MTTEKKKEKSITEEAMEAYGIDKKHVLASKEYADHVVIVTHGGVKVRFPSEEKITKLTKYQLTGVS